MPVRRRGRKPDRALDVAIRDAVVELLFDRGVTMHDLTFDQVAATAGVGRATLFRRFPTKRDMILSVVSQLSLERVEAPDTGSLRGDLVALLVSIFGVFSEPRTRRVARQFHGEACRDAAFTDLLRENLAGRLELVDTVLSRSAGRGELPPAADTALLADLISGIVALHLATHTPLPDDAGIDRLVDALLYGFVQRGDRS